MKGENGIVCIPFKFYRVVIDSAQSGINTAPSGFPALLQPKSFEEYQSSPFGYQNAVQDLEPISNEGLSTPPYNK